jgi:hypothetical protein
MVANGGGEEIPHHFKEEKVMNQELRNEINILLDKIAVSGSIELELQADEVERLMNKEAERIENGQIS